MTAGHETSFASAHSQVLFVHTSPGLHVTAPHITGAPLLELAAEVLVVVVVVPDPPTPPELVLVVPVDAVPLVVVVDPVDAVPLEVALVVLDVLAEAPVPSIVVPPQPACTRAPPARNIVIHAAFCSVTMVKPPSLCEVEERTNHPAEYAPRTGGAKETRAPRMHRGTHARPGPRVRGSPFAGGRAARATAQVSTARCTC
jgi:hypothetical protein